MDNAFLSTYLLPLVIALIMYNLGLSLTPEDFKRTFRFPKAMIIGLICQMLLLPVIAYILAVISNLPPAIKVGLILIAACPGGATSNLITYLLKGDVALSISLTSINSILILFSIPVISYLALELFMGQHTRVSMPLMNTVLKIFLMILLPTSLGLVTRLKVPGFAQRLEKILKYLTTLLLGVVYLFTFIGNNESSEITTRQLIQTAPYALILNFVGMSSGYLAGYLARFNKKRIITLVIEIGIQNSALAITIASSQAFLGNKQMALPALVYGMFTFFNAVLFGFIIRKWIPSRSV
jgi:BASS family bile acid:Na+ symporter